MIHLSVLAVAVLAAAPEELKQAVQALDDLQYERALALLPAEASVTGYEREEIAQWFSVRALAQVGLKRDAEAADSFRRLFSVAPRWVLPDQYGPRVQTLAATMRAEAAQAGSLSVRFEAGHLKTTLDPFGYARQLEISWRDGEGPIQSALLPAVPEQAVPWPRERKLEVWGRLIGLQGSTLWAWGSQDSALRIEPLEVVRVDGRALPAGPPGLRGLGVVGLGAGAAAVIAAGLGLGFAVASQGADNAQRTAARDGEGRITSLTQREAVALDQRARDDAGTASALFVTSAALVTAGAVLVLFDRLSVAPSQGGAMLTVPLDAHFGLARLEGSR